MQKYQKNQIQQSQQQHQSDTQSILSSQFDQLNYARIYDSNGKQFDFLTPSKKKLTINRKKQQNYTDSENEYQQQFNWRTQFTRTIYKNQFQRSNSINSNKSNSINSNKSFTSNNTQRTLSAIRKQSNSHINKSQQQQKQYQQTPINNHKRRQLVNKNTFDIKQSQQLLTSGYMRTITVRLKNTTQVKYENLCSICLDIHNNIIGQLKCGHKFCYQCIQEWTKSSTNCPCCRYNFKQIIKKQSKTINNNNNNNNNNTNNNSSISKHQHIQIIKVQQKQMTYNQLDYFICTECNRGDDQDVLLICDSCDFYCCHVYCDRQLNNTFPTDDWYCKYCKNVIRQSHHNHRSQRQSDGLDNNNRNMRNNQVQLIHTQTLRARSQRTNSINNHNQQDNQIYQPINNQLSQQNYLGLTQNNNNIRSGSKARQIFSEYKPKVNIRLQRVLNQINNHTSRNLRNIRRRRQH